MMNGIVHYAQQVVKTLSETLPFPVSFTDEEGYIISDSNPERIGTLHSPSVKVLEAGEMILFETSAAEKFENVLPGVAVPLYAEGKPSGVLGIVGDPHEVRPYAKLVKQYVEMMWQETKKLQAEELGQLKLESFLHFILINYESNENDRLQTYANLLHIDTSYSRVCIVIDIGHSILTQINQETNSLSKYRFKETLLHCVEMAFGKDKHNVCSFLTSKKMILIKPIKNEIDFRKFNETFKEKGSKLMDMLKVYHIDEVEISAGGRVASLHETTQSYQEAERLLEHGKDMEIKPKILSYYDWELLLKILPSQIDSNFKKYVQERLCYFFEDESVEELSENFIVYCQSNLNISQAAK